MRDQEGSSRRRLWRVDGLLARQVELLQGQLLAPGFVGAQFIARSAIIEAPMVITGSPKALAHRHT